MKFTIDAKTFAQRLAFAGGVISDRTPWPALANIHIIAGAQAITLRGSNGDTSFEATAPADIEVPGEALVSCSVLSKFVSTSKGDTVAIAVDNARATVTSGRGRIALALTDPADAPRSAPPAGEPVGLDAETITDALRFCLSAASVEDVRFYLKGVNVAEDSGCLCLAGTNGHAIHTARMAGIPTIGGGGIIPREAVPVICGIATGGEVLRLLVTESGWLAEVDGVRAWGKVIDGSFPDVARAVRSLGNPEKIAITNGKDALATIAIAECGADAGKTRARHIVFAPDGPTSLSLRGLTPSGAAVAAGRGEVDAETFGAFAGAVNATFLRAALSGMPDGDVVLSMASDAAMFVRPQQDSATLEREAVVMLWRTTPEELAEAA